MISLIPVIRPLPAFSQGLLLAALLLIPGLGTADFCLAQDRICHESTGGPCCSHPGEADEEEFPCCVTVQQDWLVPLKDSILPSAPLRSEGLPSGFPEPVSPPGTGAPGYPRPGSIDPPPRPRGVILALIQVRLI